MYPGKYAAETPDKPAVVMAGSGETLRYGDLEERSVRLSRVLRDAGLRPGDVVVLLSENSLRCFEVYWAAIRSGLYITAVNHNLAPSEVSYIVNDSGAKALVASAGKAELAAAIAPDTPAAGLKLAYGGAVAGYEPYEDALAGAPTQPLDDQPRGVEMLYSSGTTGHPKGIRPPLPERQVHEPGDELVGLVGKMFGVGPDSVYLSPAPFYHAAPMRWCGAIHSLGGTIVMMERFDAEQALAAIERYRVTHAQFVPTMFVRMLKLPERTRTGYDVLSLRAAVHAAAPCPVEVKRQMIDWWGPILVEYYASTEGAGLTLITSEQWSRKPGSVGAAALGVLHVCDDEGRELPAGEVGTVYFEREELPFRYHNDPDKTRAAQHPEHEGWTTVGDLGYVDEDGFLFLTDRKAFMIISGGVNIYPQEIENVLALHPKITDVGVIGVPDAEMGESVKAFVQPAPGVETGPDLEREIIEFVRGRIAHFKAPRSVAFVDELPRTPTGKLVKGELKALVGASAPASA